MMIDKLMTRHDKECESDIGIWDKAVLSAEICANQMANAMIMTSNLQTNPELTARRMEARKLIDACNYFRSAMAAIDQQTYEFTDEANRD